MLYFFSYASADRNKYLDQFYADLLTAVKSKAPSSLLDDVSFRDIHSIEPGVPWPKEISEALCSCKVFVYLHSPTYFTREGCGKEFKVILERLSKLESGNPVHKISAIQPIYWGGSKIPENVPNELSCIQLTHADYGEHYSAEGMLYVLQTAEAKKYWEVVHALAKRICAAAANPLPSLIEDLPLWHDIKPLFPIIVTPTTSERASPQHRRPPHPRYARFVWVVGSRAEVAEVNECRSLEPYDETDIPEEWRPFLPDCIDPARIIAQDAAREVKISYCNEPFPRESKEFHRLLATWAAAYSPVFVIVDLWSLGVDRYRTALEIFESQSFNRCLVIFPWNLKDKETRRDRDKLRELLLQTFPVEFSREDSSLVFDKITDITSFKDELVKSLAKFTADINRLLPVSRNLPTGSAFSSLPVLRI
jgi:FxsC-like protein